MAPQITRKRFKLDDTSMEQPLRSKPVNVVAKAVSGKSPVARKRRKVEDPYSSVFDHQHVEIRLADENWRARTADASPSGSQERSKSVSKLQMKDHKSGARRLKIKNPLQTADLPRPFLDADRSIQLDDFDQPPDSTSTPIMGSPRSASLEVGPYGRVDSYQNNSNDPDFDPWIVDESWPISHSQRYQEPFAPDLSPAWHPGHVYGIPLAPSSRNPDKSGILRAQHTPLRHRGIEHFSQKFTGGPTAESYPWYTVGATYKSPRRALCGGRLDARNSSQNSYRSSGGEATRSS
ncbi:LAFA_0E13498g1_1 [Lachancea sp. 'fantastica']|nr:LAFA_0E13498g1_1 [Lachancea sp. 'fantastica']